MRNVIKTLVKIIIISTLLSLLCSCTLFIRNNAVQISYSAKGYLEKAAQTQGVESQQYKILAANQLLLDNNINDAQQLLKTLNNIPLDPTVRSQKFIIEAQLALKQDNPRLAIRKLSLVGNLNTLSQQTLIAYYTTSSQAYERCNQLADSTLARINLNTLLADTKMIQKNEVIIWYNLQTLSIPILNNLLQRTNNTTIQGWIKLAIIAKQYSNNPIQLAIQIQGWQTAYPKHPANNILPDTNTLQSLSSFKTPQHIALLLPLTGQFGNMGKAIRDGFMTAFYANAKNLSQAPTVKVYDTTQTENIVSMYQQAMQDGADFIVGPLTKTNVDNLVNSGKISVPTLTLNYASSSSVPNNVIQFGFSPEQAAEQIVNFAWQHGASHAIIISPNNDWGNKVSRAFDNAWENAGGQTLNTLAFNTNQQLSDEISGVLNITQSNARADTLRQLFNEKIKSTARRRQDINSIFLAATPDQARQILPLLKFYFAGNIPVYAIANIYTGYPSPRNDHDLNGVYFDDMPWLFDYSTNVIQLKRQIQSLWASNYRNNGRLYGLGIDAYTISILLPRLIAMPNIAINGVTGQLYLQSNNSIYQQLSFARFYGGVPKGL